MLGKTRNSDQALSFGKSAIGMSTQTIFVQYKMISKKYFYGILSDILGIELMAGIQKVTRVLKPKSHCDPFWLLSVDLPLVKQVMKLLLLNAINIRWGIRLDIPYKIRKHKHSVQKPVNGIKLLAWNVQGYKSKSLELETRLNHMKIDVCLLTETLMSADLDHEIQLDKYQSFSSGSNPGLGTRGTTILAHRRFSSSEIKLTSPHCVAIRILNSPTHKGDTCGSFIFVAMYMPGRIPKEPRKQMWLDLWKDLGVYHRKGMAIIIGGDMNIKSHKKLWLEIKGAGVPWIPKNFLDKNNGMGIGTRHGWHTRVDRWSTLDYFVCNRMALRYTLKPVEILTWIDASDHFPIRLSLKVGEVEAHTGQMLKSTSQLKNQNISFWRNPQKNVVSSNSSLARTNDNAGINKKLTKFVKHNSFVLLADDLDNNRLSAMEAIAALSLTANAIGTISKLRVNRKVIQDISSLDLNLKKLSARSIRLIKKREHQFALMIKSRSPADKMTYKVIGKLVKASIRRDQRKLFMAKLKRGIELSKVSSSAWFAWTRKFYEGTEQIRVGTILENDEGHLVSDIDEVTLIWKNYCEMLASDTRKSSHLSPNEYLNMIPTSWRPKVCPIWTDSTTDSPPSWSEVKLILKEMQGNKAPGPDTLPPWLFKAILPLEEINISSGLDRADSPWGKVVFKTIQLLWSCPKLPDNLMLTDIVNIPKKGESKVLPGSYRGISLMQVILKILLRVLAKRLMNAWSHVKSVYNQGTGWVHATRRMCGASHNALRNLIETAKQKEKRVCGLLGFSQSV
jgi:exonuclease III